MASGKMQPPKIPVSLRSLAPTDEEIAEARRALAVLKKSAEQLKKAKMSMAHYLKVNEPDDEHKGVKGPTRETYLEYFLCKQARIRILPRPCPALSFHFAASTSSLFLSPAPFQIP